MEPSLKPPPFLAQLSDEGSVKPMRVLDGGHSSTRRNTDGRLLPSIVTRDQRSEIQDNLGLGCVRLSLYHKPDMDPTSMAFHLSEPTGNSHESVSCLSTAFALNSSSDPRRLYSSAVTPLDSNPATCPTPLRYWKKPFLNISAMILTCGRENVALPPSVLIKMRFSRSRTTRIRRLYEVSVSTSGVSVVNFKSWIKT